MTFSTSRRRKDDVKSLDSIACEGKQKTSASKLTWSTNENASKAAASPFDPSPTSSPSSSSTSSSFSFSLGIYFGFYMWVLVVTAGLGPTLWSSMWLCWTLGKSARGWLCLVRGDENVFIFSFISRSFFNFLFFFAERATFSFPFSLSLYFVSLFRSLSISPLFFPPSITHHRRE